MRRRVTFIRDHNTNFSPDELQISDERVSFAGLNAAREERLTLGLGELPEELQQVLRHAHEVHIRWASEYVYEARAPYSSRISPGLHVFYTPLDGHSEDLVCSFLRKVFSNTLKCHSPAKTFIRPPLVSERFAATSATQYHSLLPSLSNLVAYIQRHVCARSDVTCTHTASLLNIAESLDIDYDSISHTLMVNAFWSRPPAILYDPVGEWTTYDAWNLDAQRKSQNDRVEVGILESLPADDEHDVKLSGHLTVVGEDDRPKPTLFNFPSRHHALPSKQLQVQAFTVSIHQPQGLHPSMEILFPNSMRLQPPENRPNGSQCALQAYLTLPSYIFADEYAFNSGDPLFAESHNIRATRAIAGENDLEAPDYLVDRWGSILLLELATPTHATNTTLTSNMPWKVDIPLHLRYLAPNHEGVSPVDLPWPVVYWACTAEEGTKFPVNPFDRVNIGYDGLYGPRTMFYHLQPKPVSSERIVERLVVPVYATDTTSANTIQFGTLLVILAGFLWVTVRLLPGLKVEISESLASSPVSARRKKQ